MLLDSLLVLLVLVCIALGAVILLQRSEGGAFGMGGSPSGLMTARGAGDLLTRTTSILAAVFFGLCLLLTILSGRTHSGESVVDRLKVDALNPDALNKSMRPAQAPAAPPSAASPQAVEAPPSAANTLTAKPSAQPVFEAPAPQVHTAPAPPAARRSTPPAVTSDNGAHAPVSSLLGYQTAPQAAPTLAPNAPVKPAAEAKPTASPEPPEAKPPAATGNTTQ